MPQTEQNGGLKMVIESESIKKMYDGVSYDWDIDPNDRAWVIDLDGKLYSGISHKLLLKNNFHDDWKLFVQSGQTEDEAERVLTYRLLRTGRIIVSELDEFYSEVQDLYFRTRDAISGFARSILKTRDVGDKLFAIQSRHLSGAWEKILETTLNGETIKRTVSEIANSTAWCLTHE